MELQTALRRGVAVSARLLIIPAFLEPRISAFGAWLWRRAARADIRAFIRWLALNWAKVAAWWITVGLVLTALLLLVALAAWKDPRIIFAAVNSLGDMAKAKVTDNSLDLGLIVFLITLPLTLPLALLTVLVVVVVVAAVLILGPVGVMVGVPFLLLFGFATMKRFGAWLAEFIVKAIHRGDEQRGFFMRLRDAIGLTGAPVTAEGKHLYMEGEELRLTMQANKARAKGAPVFLGFVEGQRFDYYSEKHLFMAAGSRGGKGRDLIVPNLKIYPESDFVLDPKGENYEQTAGYRLQNHKNRLAVFDPYALTKAQPQASFNPLAHIKGDDMVTGAGYVADALVIGPNDHWHDSARDLLRALVLHMVTAPAEMLRKRAVDLPALRALLTGQLDLTLEDMTQNPALDGLVKRLAESLRDIPPNERGSIISTARRATSWLDNERLAGMFKAGQNCISFDDLRDPGKRLSVYVCLPAFVFGAFPEVCRLLTTFALDTMMRSRTTRTRPVMFVLDELAQLNKLSIVERAFTLGAGFGVQMWAVFQSIEQAEKLYPLDALYGSSGIRLFFNLQDPGSCEYVSKCTSEVCKPGDVRHLGETKMLALLDGCNPLIIDRLVSRMGGEQASPPSASQALQPSGA